MNKCALKNRALRIHPRQGWVGSERATSKALPRCAIAGRSSSRTERTRDSVMHAGPPGRPEVWGASVPPPLSVPSLLIYGSLNYESPSSALEHRSVERGGAVRGGAGQRAGLVSQYQSSGLTVYPAGTAQAGFSLGRSSDSEAQVGPIRTQSCAVRRRAAQHPPGFPLICSEQMD